MQSACRLNALYFEYVQHDSRTRQAMAHRKSRRAAERGKPGEPALGRAVEPAARSAVAKRGDQLRRYVRDADDDESAVAAERGQLLGHLGQPGRDRRDGAERQVVRPPPRGRWVSSKQYQRTQGGSHAHNRNAVSPATRSRHTAGTSTTL